jgi:hypothetical protein
MDCNHIIQIADNGKDWVDYLSALLVPGIAVLGATIAILQWRTNANRLRHELFDRRYAQFVIVREFLGSIMTSGKSQSIEQFEFKSGISGMQFIFDKEIEEYVNKNIWHLACDLECLDAELEGVPVGEERSRNVKKQAEIKRQLYKELKSLEDTFAKYLQLQH